MHRKLIARYALLTTLITAPSFAAVEAMPVKATASERQVVSHPPERAALGTPSEEARYASRQAASPDAKKYRGGDVIVISATAVAIVLLVVLILILI